MKRKKTKKAVSKQRTDPRDLPYKYFNVFYTPTPVELEVVIRARTLEEAVLHVKAALCTLHCEEIKSIRAGWEVSVNE